MVTIRIDEASLGRLRKHLLPDRSRREQGAFLFCRNSVLTEGHVVFDCQSWVALKPEDYDVQENDYLELADATRARLIKQAHDGQFSLVESHSHPGPYPAAFSFSDLSASASLSYFHSCHDRSWVMTPIFHRDTKKDPHSDGNAG